MHHIAAGDASFDKPPLLCYNETNNTKGGGTMKETKWLGIILLLICILQSCTRQEKVLDSLGSYESEAFYTSGGIQDFTDYAKYQYKSVDLQNNKYFSVINDNDIKKLNQYIDNFQSWVTAIENSDPTNELVMNYDFDCSAIDTSDYYYIYDKMGKPIGESVYEQFDCYDVYFFDSQTNILYYFHNNI